MHDSRELAQSWSRVGGWSGLAGIAAYVAAAFAPLPEIGGYAAAFAFGPLVAISSIGLRFALATERPGPLVDIAAIFGVGAGFTVLAMLTTQQAIFGLMRRAIDGAADAAAADVEQRIAAGLNSIHFGLDVAWDVLIGVAVVLFGCAMLGHSRFGKLAGLPGIALGLLLLAFNLATFPVPPEAAGSFDWGPFVALWMIVAFVLLLRSARPSQESA